MKHKPTKLDIKVFVRLLPLMAIFISFMCALERVNIFISFWCALVRAWGLFDVGLCTRVLLWTRVVLELMEGLECSGHELFVNFYTSAPVYFTRYNRWINVCSRLRNNWRAFPKELM